MKSWLLGHPAKVIDSSDKIGTIVRTFRWNSSLMITIQTQGGFLVTVDSSKVHVLDVPSAQKDD